MPELRLGPGDYLRFGAAIAPHWKRAQERPGPKPRGFLAAIDGVDVILDPQLREDRWSQCEPLIARAESGEASYA